MSMYRRLSQLFVLCCALVLQPAVAQEAEGKTDPWEGYNRAMFSFNDALDRAILKPVAKGYRFVMPDIAEKGVNNFFENLSDVGTMVNNILQGKPDRAIVDFTRVLVNTTVGIGGLIDVATAMDLPKHDEDFGQTLGVWGLDSGPYLVLPLLGPSSLRDGVGLVPDFMLDPVQQVDDDEVRLALSLVRVIDTRAELLKAEEVISGDRYSFIRDAYMQRREFAVNDGELQFDPDDF